MGMGQVKPYVMAGLIFVIGMVKHGLLKQRCLGEHRVNCGNPKSFMGYGNPQPSSRNGFRVREKVQRLGSDEPTNNLPFSARHPHLVGGEEIVRANRKRLDNLHDDHRLLRVPVTA